MHSILRSLLIVCGLASLLAACETAPVSGRSQMMLVSETRSASWAWQA